MNISKVSVISPSLPVFLPQLSAVRAIPWRGVACLLGALSLAAPAVQAASPKPWEGKALASALAAPAQQEVLPPPMEEQPLYSAWVETAEPSSGASEELWGGSDRPHPVQAQTSEPEPDTTAPSPVYGDPGMHRWYAQVAAATNLDGSAFGSFGLVGAGISHFFAPGQSFNLELNGMGFVQDGDDALGLNLALLHRWDFVRQENWSLYIDGGAGIIGTTNDVPAEGSSFAFTPQAGGGATIRLNDDQRLMVGLRWHHISNANIFDDNPGQDSIFGYIGINFPR